MQALDDRIIFSASDLSGFLACRHLTQLERRAAEGTIERPHRHDPLLDLLSRRGLEHEAAFLANLEAAGLSVIQIPFPASDLAGLTDGAERTQSALASGVDVIYQGTLFDGTWRGHPDFLRRVEQPSELGDFSYEVLDAKLARRPKATALLQLCFYADQLAQVQGIAPKEIHIVLGSGAVESFRLDAFSPYFRTIRSLFEEAVAKSEKTYPEPVEHCRICRWAGVCNGRRREDDYLSLVAGMRRDQIKKLQAGGIPTVAALAEHVIDQPIQGFALPILERLRDQASMQVDQRKSGVANYKILDPLGVGFGLEALPKPAAGDIFFDIEADPYAEVEGLEFLFGFIELRDGQPTYRALWAHNPDEEKQVFEQFVDLVSSRFEEFPEMHVYHYAPYEASALKRLMGRYGTREAELDRLLRAGVFVDLYQVVRQGIRISAESYSIKRLESFTGLERTDPITEGGSALVEYERYLELGENSILEGLEDYNRYDCLSLVELQRWLEELRVEAERKLERSLERPAVISGEASGLLAEVTDYTAALQDRLLDGVSEDLNERSAEDVAKSVLAHLLSWHRREAKSEWWQYFARRALTSEEAIDDSDCLGGIAHQGIVGEEARSYIHSYSFPAQEHKIEAGGIYLDIATEKRVGTVLEVSDERRQLLVKKQKNRTDHPEALMLSKPIGTVPLRQAIATLAERVVEQGMDDRGGDSAIKDLLLKRPPIVDGESGSLRREGESTLEAACRLVKTLDGSYLPIQGPPGTGKTFTGAHMILTLLAEGHKVGITANSHKVIGNLLEEVFKQAQERGVDFAALQRCPEDESCDVADVRVAADNSRFDTDFATGEYALVAGTPWLFSRPELRGALHTLVIDEAGQFALANAAAIAACSRNLVLLGDPQQLSQPSKGVHPPGAGLSILEYVLDGAKTIPADRGLFLERTWRMHPAICEFISDAFYEGRLESEEACAVQSVDSAGPFSVPGTYLVLRPHVGSRIASSEEAKEVAAILDEAASGTWIDSSGASRPMALDDILIVAPYNAHVSLLKRSLPEGARVGTVDKFQGQEGALTVYSMATSTPDDIPRTFEFLYSLNRLNVAVSRARAVAVIVCSPELLRARCRTPRQMELAAAICRYAEMSEAR